MASHDVHFFYASINSSERASDYYVLGPLFCSTASAASSSLTTFEAHRRTDSGYSSLEIKGDTRHYQVLLLT